ncbi:predicted protein [Uncinocarpus reesii 1704]|uniref:FAS1 domain-containing protein n=1 Tax=Uncinocarpus reesii (strain UAMH 1704) TaxID=336963 RepID=C4JPF2_UNCRE|nr:uncharacterized protein UREG_04534 [Uncinocarpus reesii 1704]EEP79688.1 predicted protein [Uncinocarpus reesii 1704]
MKAKHAALVAFLAVGSYALNLSETISDIPQLSNMSVYISQNSSLQSMFDTPDNITILAPDNAAFGNLVRVEPNGSVPLGNMSLISGILQYHIFKGAYKANDFTSKSKFISSFLNDTTFTNVTTGQVVRAVQENNTVHCISGLNDDAQFVNQSRTFDHGILHIINQVLTLPQTVTYTALLANLGSFVGAINKGNNIDTVNLPKDATVFIPNNEGFRRVGSIFSNMSSDDIARIMSYHVVKDKIVYSVDMTNQSLSTEAGEDLHLSVINGSAFVNSAKIVSTDLLVNNGVAHVISDVLNPDNTTAKPEPKANEQPVAFGGASSVTTDPLTSGISSPTSTISLEPATPIGAITTTTSPTTTSSSTTSSSTTSTTSPTTSPTRGAAPIETANVGVAAILGIGAAIINV